LKNDELFDIEKMAKQAGSMAGKAFRKTLDIIKAGEKGFKAGMSGPKVRPPIKVEVEEGDLQ
jgi:hypothetical protein